MSVIRRKLLATSMLVLAAGASFPFCEPALAQSNDDCTPGSVIHYVNGIRTDFDGSTADAAALRDAVGRTTTSDGKPIRYYYTWNPNNGILGIGDFEESIMQWARQRGLESFLQGVALKLAKSVTSGRLNLYLTILQRILPGVVDDAFITAFRAFVQVELVRLLAAQSRANVIAQRVTQHVQNFVQQGNRVVLVTHSQGNFVGNEVYDSLASNLRSSVRRVGVAVPSNAIAGGGPYTTLKRDLIWRVPGALPANFPSGDQTVDCPDDATFNHSFVSCYLNAGETAWSLGAQARNNVKAAIDQALTIPMPSVVTRLGNIVATLTWQSPADVDLHGYEPDATHVYYAARVGRTAQLDRDDTTGTGPENIFVCGEPTVGSYRFGVNYFRGDQAQTATVILNGGGVPRTFTVPVTRGIGSAGNNPAPFGQVIVTRDNNGYHYEVR